ncbi:aldolase [Obba rivulosa]|uniref:hydroxymethylglutaryl-CoA lyase n=1 Tax=Obba rivulosa TaxID=1052685 RepID=A0A8E2AJR4_9APHY|nr:aldolase [Obba rivulosa]
MRHARQSCTLCAPGISRCSCDTSACDVLEPSAGLLDDIEESMGRSWSSQATSTERMMGAVGDKRRTGTGDDPHDQDHQVTRDHDALHAIKLAFLHFSIWPLLSLLFAMFSRQLSRPLRAVPALRRTPAAAHSAVPRARTYASLPAGQNSKFVNIVEVGPRDGLQNEKFIIPPALKAELINRLGRAGLRTIEAGSFVSPEWVPQMAGTDEVLKLMEKHPDVHYPVLVPNMKGLDNLLALLGSNPPAEGQPPLTDEIAVFTAATDAFCKANTNCTIAESLARLEPVVQLALQKGLRVRGYVSVVVECPYTGKVDPKKVKEVTRALLDMGCYEVSLGDTTGAGTPWSIRTMLHTVMGGDGGVPPSKLAAHFHDTFGMGVVNVLTALSLGLRTVDTAVGGLGGCPYSPGATGNVATEDVLYMLQKSELEAPGDLEALAEIGDWISKELKRDNSSRTGKAIMGRKARERLEKERENDGGLAEQIASKL